MTLKLDEAARFIETFTTRRERFPDEPIEFALMTVLLNFGDHLTIVACGRCEYVGAKGELPVSSGVPKCPNGHPLFESFDQYRLELVKQIEVTWT